MASGHTFSLAQALTGTAPTTATEGQALKDLDAITVVLLAASGQTLSGGGTLNCYVYDADVGVWVRYPGADLTVTASSVRGQAFTPVEIVGARNARVLWVTSSVTVSAGTVTTYQLGFSERVKDFYV